MRFKYTIFFTGTYLHNKLAYVARRGRAHANYSNECYHIINSNTYSVQIKTIIKCALPKLASLIDFLL